MNNMTNQQKLRELINKAFDGELFSHKTEFTTWDRKTEIVDVWKPIDLSHLLIALGKRGYEIVTGIDTHIMVIRIGKLVIPYDLTKPPLEQSEETLTELINLLL